MYFNPLVPVALATALISLWLGWRRLGRLRWAFLPAWLALFLCSWTPFNHLCLLSLESSYRADTALPPATDFDAIVVLSAGALAPTPWAPDGVIGPGTYVRCQHGAWLYRHVKPVPVLVSGGRVPGSGGATSYAQMMRSLLIGMGVPAGEILTEDESRDTYQNALFSAAILRYHKLRKVALVTEAYHMPRAAACFRKQGIAVVAAPTGFLSPTTYTWGDFVPKSSGLSVTDIIIHEWVGLAVYRAAGRI